MGEAYTGGGPRAGVRRVSFSAAARGSAGEDTMNGTRLGLLAAGTLAVAAIMTATSPPTPTPASGNLDTKERYSGVLLQQGRVQTDKDWNDQVDRCRKENADLKRQIDLLKSENLRLKQGAPPPKTPVSLRR
jgi:hypothetical protein